MAKFSGVFTNNSTNADQYFWDFGDGSTSTDTNPWHDYTTTGNWLVMLVAENSLCPNDTMYLNVSVIDYTTISENENALTIYPNPFHDKIYLSGLSSQNTIQINLLSATGELVFSNQIFTAKYIRNSAG